MVGRQKLSGNQAVIQFKVCIALCNCKNILPKTDYLKGEAYRRVLQDLSNLQVSPRNVADVWRQHKEDILDPLNKDLYESLKHKQGVENPRKISIVELQTRVRAVPYHFHKNVWTL
jgi:hypothetical protein